jgi:hypothetical protein
MAHLSFHTGTWVCGALFLHGAFREARPGSVAPGVRRSEHRLRRRSCGGGGVALHVPRASIVFGGGFYSVQTTKSAVTTSGIRQSPKQPPSTANCNLPLIDCSRAQNFVFVRDLTLVCTSGTGFWSVAGLVRRRGTLVSISRFHAIV